MLRIEMKLNTPIPILNSVYGHNNHFFLFLILFFITVYLTLTISNISISTKSINSSTIIKEKRIWNTEKFELPV